jgi:hypothetical protein
MQDDRNEVIGVDRAIAGRKGCDIGWTLRRRTVRTGTPGENHADQVIRINNR